MPKGAENEGIIIHVLLWELLRFSAAENEGIRLDKHGCLKVLQSLKGYCRHSFWFSYLQKCNVLYQGMVERNWKKRGIVIRFVIGHSSTPGGVLDRAIDADEAQHNDFLRLKGYHELSSKRQNYFSTAKWDADFYIKVDDDVHVNLGVLSSLLSCHQSKPRIYIGCMKSCPVLEQKGVNYQEHEFWKFGEEGNKYFRHATGQIYAISKDLATYISVNRHLLHRYANEDVALGSWLIGLDVEHVDDRTLCCGTPLDCEWKVQAGNPCAATFDWSCSGICKSAERMELVHRHCGEGDGAVWHSSLNIL